MKDPDLESHHLDVTLFYFHFHFAEPLRIDPLATGALNSPDSPIHPCAFHRRTPNDVEHVTHHTLAFGLTYFKAMKTFFQIHDLSYGGSSSDEEDGFRARAAGAAGGLLYVGLGTVALGLVISFVGTGDKGFKTLELRWTGPALIAAGLFFCIIRILLCALPRRCQHPRPRHRPKEPAAERLLLTERPPPPPRRLSIAATALMLQHEKEQPQQHIQLQQQLKQQQLQPPSPPPPPQPPPHIIPLVLLSQPQQHNRDDSLIELQTMDGSSFDISSISSSEISVDNLTVIENAEVERTCKLNRTREPLHAKRTSSLTPGVPRTVTFADTPNIIAPPSEAPPPAAEIVLTPSNLTH